MNNDSGTQPNEEARDSPSSVFSDNRQLTTDNLSELPIDNSAADRKKGLFGVGWTTLVQILGMVLRLGSSLVLTRLLAPEAYGIFGPALAVLLVVELISDLGVRPALLRHPEGMSPEWLGTGWIITFVRGICLSLLILGSSQIIPVLLEKPALEPVLLVLALRPFLQSLYNPCLPILYREMNFRSISLIELLQTATGVVAGISLAAGLGITSYWAMVGGVFAADIVVLIAGYILAPSPIRPRWSRDAARAISTLGRQIYVNTMVMALWMYYDRILGLRFISEAEMGAYILAWNLVEMLDRIINRGCDVYFSLLSREMDPERQLRLHRKISWRVAWAVMPLMTLGIIAAPWVMLVYPQDKFGPARWILAVLVGRMMFRAIGQIQFQYLLVRAEVWMATRCYVLAFVLQAAIFSPIVSRYGVNGIAYVVTISTLVYTLSQNVIFWWRGELGFWEIAITTWWVAVGLTVTWLMLG